ncbi:MAG: hypothetical protein AB7O97_14765 [Planctomycetota bacterium]
MRAILALSVAGLIASAASAQTPNFLGFNAGFNTSYTDRGGAGANSIDVDVLQCFRTRDYRYWNMDPANPLMSDHTLVGMRVDIQDQIGNTPETYTMVGYRDDPLNPGSPDIDLTGAGIWFRAGPFNTPPSTATGAVVITTLIGINPPSDVHTGLPGTRDNIYLGLGLNGGTWPADGLGIHMSFDMNSGNTGTNSLDVVNPLITSVETNNFVVTVPNTGGGAAALPTGGLATYAGPGTIGSYRQIDLEVLARATGGVSITTTNQLRYPGSLPNPSAVAPLGGTANMTSGLFPDVNDSSAILPPPVGSPVRQDDFGFLITERNRPGSLAVVRMQFGYLAGGSNPDGSVPAIFAPGFGAAGTTGVICADIFDPAGFTFIGALDANGRFQQMFGLNAAGRAAIAAVGPVDLVWQGFVINLALSPAEVKATGCVTQHVF